MSESVNLSSNSIIDNLTDIKDIVRGFELGLRGYVWDSRGNSYKHSTDALASDNFISSAVNLLQTFAEKTNLLTTKKYEKFMFQYWEIVSRCIAFTCESGVGLPKKNQQNIIKMFKSCLSNIGDIIVGNRELTGKIIYNNDEVKQDGGIYA